VLSTGSCLPNHAIVAHHSFCPHDDRALAQSTVGQYSAANAPEESFRRFRHNRSDGGSLERGTSRRKCEGTARIEEGTIVGDSSKAERLQVLRLGI
jgi:hypothetical protein